MAPTHVLGLDPQRVELVEQVPSPIQITEPVGVVHPVAFRRVVEAGPPVLGVHRASCTIVLVVALFQTGPPYERNRGLAALI